MSKISGILREEESQVRWFRCGAKTLKLFEFVKFYKVTPRGLFTRQHFKYEMNITVHVGFLISIKIDIC